MDYPQYKLDDFLADDAFVQWVKYPEPKTSAFWQQFIRDFPEQETVIKQARSVLNTLQFQEDGVSSHMVQAEWERFKQEINTSATTHPGRVISLYTKRIWWAAASLAGLLIGFFMWTNQTPSDTVYKTAFGEVKHIRLPDGSQLTLNANTQVRIPGDWARRHERDVWLKGEGFFQVVKRPNQPQSRFLVHTDEAVVEVLGTRFNLRSRRGEADVLLQEGSVRLKLKSRDTDTVRSLLMKPGEGVHFKAITGSIKHWRASPGQMGSWREGVLQLERMTLGELGQIIEDIYGHQVVIQTPALASRVLSGSLPTQNEQALLDGIAVTLKVTVHRQNDQIVFSN
jgi:transmembrane sensor